MLAVTEVGAGEKNRDCAHYEVKLVIERAVDDIEGERFFAVLRMTEVGGALSGENDNEELTDKYKMIMIGESDENGKIV